MSRYRLGVACVVLAGADLVLLHACGALMLCGSVGVALYLQSIGWHGRWWTGLMQRSLVFPALLWLLGLLGWLARK